MACDDFHSINCALLDDDPQRYPKLTRNSMMTSSSMKIPKTTNKWTLRNQLTTASLRRYRSPFRRDSQQQSSLSSSDSPTSSFPLFRHFYLMRNSIKHKRSRQRHDTNNNPIDHFTSEQFYSTPRLQTHHILLTIFITILSIFFLIAMIIVDLFYVNDAVLNTNTNQILCLQYPKICVMKGLVIFVFICITIILCYSVLRLYIRARRHSQELEQKTKELEKEKCLTQKLLHEILPPCVARDLIRGRKAPAESYDSVTVFFSDIVGFTGIAR